VRLFTLHMSQTANLLSTCCRFGNCSTGSNPISFRSFAFVASNRETISSTVLNEHLDVIEEISTSCRGPEILDPFDSSLKSLVPACKMHHYNQYFL
jgi:hypothetical protein